MSDTASTQNKLCNLAVEAERTGDAPAAISAFREAIRVAPENPVPYLYLGHVLYADSQEELALQVYSLGADLDSRVLAVPASADPALVERSILANARVRAKFSALHQNAVDEFEQENAATVPRIRAAIWCQTHAAPFDFASAQRPQLFYVPEIKAQPWFGTDDLPWLAKLEAGFKAIRAEFNGLLANRPEAEVPYLRGAASNDAAWQAIQNSRNWGTFPLYEAGVGNEKLLPFTPSTLEVLSGLPLAGVTSSQFAPREIVFSVLQPGQCIPPHYGLSNCGVTVHLPLITFGDAGLQVAGKIENWQRGRAVAFDDSYLHESWNRSDEVRVNLLFEAWHPDLSNVERGAVEAAYAARRDWAESRAIV